MKNEITVQNIQNLIVNLPGRPPAMLAQDLARVYDTETRRVNEAVKRNIERFPDDFMFQATEKETNILRSQNAMSQKARTANPYLFTQSGANMLSAVLHSDVAVARSIQITRAFTNYEQKGTMIDSSQMSSLDIAKHCVEISTRLLAAEQERYQMEGLVSHQAQVIAEQTPKIKALARIAGEDESILITDAAKTLKIQPRKLFSWLDLNGWIYKRSSNSSYSAYQDKINQGLMIHHYRTYYNESDPRETRSARLTPKGMTRLGEIFADIFEQQI